ncbi:MAG: zinc ribbon domain-containing protein [Verrucomicrobiae bacterium]|nr:zinc ribbon domain-containing protein [Verrucomicrobiae bacterium]
MPIYEFSCAKCDHEFELLVRSSKNASECPRCGSKKLSRKLSVFSARQGGRRSSRAASCPNYSPSSCGGCCGASCHAK